MSVEIYIPTIEELKAFRKSDQVQDFCYLKGNDYTGGLSYLAWMWYKHLTGGWHIMAFLITAFAIIGGFVVEGDAWALLFVIPYSTYWIGNYMVWRDKRKGSNPDRKFKGMSLSEFVVRTHTPHIGWRLITVSALLAQERISLFFAAEKQGLLTDPLDEKFWRWLELNW